MRTKIIKFGGTSVGSKEAIENVLKIIQNNNQDKLVVVVSAQSGITDMLLGLVTQNTGTSEIKSRILTLASDLKIEQQLFINIFTELENSLGLDLKLEEKKDLIASFGERISIILISAYLKAHGINSQPIDSREFIITDSNFVNAKYILDLTQAASKKYLLPLLENQVIPIITGFIGKDIQGRTTTLGRGGSDLSATLIGECLEAELVEIWTDVNGILSADPRIVENTKHYSNVSFVEAVELSNFGAKVIYSKSLIPSIRSNIPVKVLNTFNLTSEGTTVTSEAISLNNIFVTSKNDITTVTVSNPEMIDATGYLQKVFTTFSNHSLSIDVVSVSEASISSTLYKIDKQSLENLVAELSIIGKVEVASDLSMVSVISIHKQEIIPRSIKVLSDNNIPIKMISFGNSQINLTFIVPAEQGNIAVNLIHTELLANK